MSRVAPLTPHAFGAKTHVRSESADQAAVIAKMGGNAAGPARAATKFPSPTDATRQAIEWLNPGAADALVKYRPVSDERAFVATDS